MIVSYDVARELFVDINKAFIAKHPGVSIDHSHAGTSPQARDRTIELFLENAARHFAGQPLLTPLQA